MDNQYILVERMDVGHDKRALVNELYDTVLIPALLKVPGVLKASRYQTANAAEPRYLAIYEISSPGLTETPEWKKAADAGKWLTDGRPHTFNLHRATYTRVGDSKELTYRSLYLSFAMMDVEPHKETLFNELYDKPHLPLILKVPGWLNAVRYKTSAEGHPKYLAIYEIERPEVVGTPAARKAADTGRWKPEVRPYTYNKHSNVVYERIGDVRTP